MHHADYALAETLLEELKKLRFRSVAATAQEVQFIADKTATSTDIAPLESRDAVTNVRAEAWLGICDLAFAMEKHPQSPDISFQWERAIDLVHGWMHAAD